MGNSKYLASMTHKYNDKEQESFMACEPSSWGGQWTEEKLDAFEKYVNAYLTIMNVYKERYRWKLIYFDGFAGQRHFLPFGSFRMREDYDASHDRGV